MSRESENVEMVRAAVDSINRRDLDQALQAAHEDFEADWSNSIAPHGGVYRGRERVRGAHLWTIIGEVRSVKLYQSKADALEAVGFAHP